MAESIGDAAQTRRIAEQVGESAATIAIHKFLAEHPELKPKPEVPPPLKWAAGILAALLTTGVGGTAVWLMTTVNEMQVTIARIDERMDGNASSLDSRFDALDGRVSKLEGYRAGGER